jgi:hypothetical protein
VLASNDVTNRPRPTQHQPSRVRGGWLCTLLFCVSLSVSVLSLGLLAGAVSAAGGMSGVVEVSRFGSLVTLPLYCLPIAVLSGGVLWERRNR